MAITTAQQALLEDYIQKWIEKVCEDVSHYWPEDAAKMLAAQAVATIRYGVTAEKLALEDNQH